MTVVRGSRIVLWPLALIVLAWFTGTQTASNVDFGFASWISGLRGELGGGTGSGMDGFMLSVGNTVRPLYIAPVTLVAAVVLWFRLRRWALLIPASFGSAIVVTYVLKWLLARNRPGAEFSLAGVGDLRDSAFPSAHVAAVTSTGMAVAQLAVPVLRRAVRRLLTLAITCLIGAVALSRVWIGAHWLTDVIGGLIAGVVGLGLALAALKIFGRLSRTQRYR